MGIGINRTEEMQRKNLKNNEIYQLVMEHSRDLIRIIDADLNFLYVSPSHEDVLGYTPDEIIHTPVLEILHPDERELAISMHRDLMSKSKSLNGLFRYQCKNGQWITIETCDNSLVKDGEIVGVVTIGRDVTERVRLEQQLREYQKQLEFLAWHDPLTNLPNRTLFFDRTFQAIKDAKCNGHSLAILYLDSDDFKIVNDSYGHSMGDKVIMELGRRISSSIRNNDTVARLGGDEFTILLPSLNRKHDVDEVANRIMQSINLPWDIMSKEIKLTVSIGVAIYPFDGEDTEELIMHADEALYKAKKQKKNKYVFYRPKE